MLGSHDRFVAAGNVASNLFGWRINVSKKVHDQRVAIEYLVNVQENRRRSGLGQCGMAGLDRFAFVSFEPAQQQLVLIRRFPQNLYLGGRLGRPAGGDDLGQFDPSTGASNHPIAAAKRRVGLGDK